jgi:SAM-dependent methyltransferase
LALARRGYQLTGVDWSMEFLNHARSSDTLHAVTWEQRDMRDLPWSARFDGAFCFGNSFGYLDDEGNAAFLRSVAAALKPGARFILETPMVLENLLGHLQERAWWRVGDMRLLVVNQYDPMRERLDIEYTFVSDGRVEVRSGSHRAYSCRELVHLFEAADFAVELAQPWTRAAHTVTFIATRR